MELVKKVFPDSAQEITNVLFEFVLARLVIHWMKLFDGQYSRPIVPLPRIQSHMTAQVIYTKCKRSMTPDSK